MKNTIKAVVFAAALCVAPSAKAVLLGYTVGADSVVNANTGSGLIISTELNGALEGTHFSLDDGDSWTFDFFRIWTTEGSVESDDRSPKAISATLDFSDPDTGATVNGITFGGSILFGLTQWGQVVWENPAPTFTLGDRVFSVDLSDEVFNKGLFGLKSGDRAGATVEATVTQISSSSVNQVPDHGNTAILLGLALTGVAYIHRKRLVA